MRSAFCAIAFVVAAHSWCSARADESGPKELVRRLVSPNARVNPKVEPFVFYPSSYDHEAQKAVRKASDDLYKLGFKAIPALIDGLDDGRYCRSYFTSLMIDISVGEECFDVLDRVTNPDVKPDNGALPKEQFEEGFKGARGRMGADGKFHHVDRSYLELLGYRARTVTRMSLATWWNDFSDKSLDSIHLAAIRRRIAFEEKIGFAPGADGERYLKPYRDIEKLLASRLQSK